MMTLRLSTEDGRSCPSSLVSKRKLVHYTLLASFICLDESCVTHLHHAGNETFEKLGTIGTLANLLVYLTTVFNLNSITATNIINIFNGSASLATLPGAFLSDTYFGRYKTLGFSTIASFLVLMLLLTCFPLAHLICLPKHEIHI